jgi:hypothetical protein
MLLVVDQDVVGALPADAAHEEPFVVTVRSRRPRWNLDYLQAFGGEHLVERGGELRISVTDKKTKRRGPITQIQDQVAGLLGGPLTGRVRRNAEDVHPAGHHLHHHQDVQAPQRNRVDVKEVGREQPGRLRPQERPPTRVATARCRAKTRTGEDPPNGTGADPIAQAEELTLNSPMSPSWILPGEPDDQRFDLVADRWTARPVRIRPMLLDESAMPRQHGARGNETMLSHPSGQQPGQRGQHRPIRPRQIRPADLAAQNCDLVTQNEQLHGLRRVASHEPRQPPKHLNHPQVQHPNHHDQILHGINKPPAHRPCDEVLAQDSLAKTMPAPVPPDERDRLTGARRATDPTPPPASAMRVQRNVPNDGVIMVARQRLRVGRAHAGKTVTVILEDTYLRVLHDDQELSIHPRTSVETINRFMAQDRAK